MDPNRLTQKSQEALQDAQAEAVRYGHTEVDQKRVDIVHQMLTRFYLSATYDVIYTYPDLQAYRKNKFTGWIRQPEGTGPVLFSNTSPTYAALRPVAASAGKSGDSGGGGGGNGALIAIIAVVAILVAGGAVWMMRRRTADERE